MALKDTDLITYGTLKSVVAKQNEVYDAKYVAKSSLTESPSGNLRIVANNKGYELLSTNSAINVSKLEGVIGVEHIPNAALERVIPVANQAARFQLTEEQAQLGDVIKENDSGKMFFVTDLTNLGNANGYMEFAVGTAADVSWENVSGKPNLSEVGHTHSGSDITSAVANATNAVNATNASNVPWTGVSNKPALAASLSISGSTLALNDSDGVNMSTVTLPEGNGSNINSISSDDVTSLAGLNAACQETYNTWDGLENSAFTKLNNHQELTSDEQNAYDGYITLPVDGNGVDNIEELDLNQLLSYIMWMLDRRPSFNVVENTIDYWLTEKYHLTESGSGSSGVNISDVFSINDETNTLTANIDGNIYRLLDEDRTFSVDKATGEVSIRAYGNLYPLSSSGSSGGGSATLSAAGSEYQPVYINNSGVPTACSFKIMQVSSLPANPDQDTLYIVTGA